MVWKKLGLRQSLALWTMVPMILFSLFVILFSFAWSWLNVQQDADERNARLAHTTALALSQQSDIEQICARLAVFAGHSTQVFYVVDGSGQIHCAPPGAPRAVGDNVDYDLAAVKKEDALPDTSSLRDLDYSVSYAPIPGTPWGVLLQEARSAFLAPTYSFLVAISALTVVVLFTSFWLLWVGFHRISWPLLAVTEQARRVAAGETFIPPDVDGPAEVEALVAAFNLMVTQLGQQRDRLHDYAVRTLHSQEEERKRISRDLHDETAQELVGLMQRIDLCRLSAENEPEIQAALDELAQLADRTLAGVRRTSRALRPLILEDLGLVAALQAIGDDLEQQLPGGRVFCEVIGEEQRLPPEVELSAFRIVQEALTNVRKHAVTASRVYVTVQFKPDTLQISVEDDGRGFYVFQSGDLAQNEHLGLLGMRERAELLNGKWIVDSSPGAGTRVSFELPISGPDHT